jgi:hypothetical protein
MIHQESNGTFGHLLCKARTKVVAMPRQLCNCLQPTELADVDAVAALRASGADATIFASKKPFDRQSCGTSALYH